MPTDTSGMFVVMVEAGIRLTGLKDGKEFELLFATEEAAWGHLSWLNATNGITFPDAFLITKEDWYAGKGNIHEETNT